MSEPPDELSRHEHSFDIGWNVLIAIVAICLTLTKIFT